MNHLFKDFPNLRNTHCVLTSPQDITYNCIAWAAEEDGRWWWPDSMSNYFWPNDVLREETLEAFIEAFALLGFSTCENGDHEMGFEKAAIFLDSEQKVTHMARQLNSGKWTSKLGGLEDIEHELAGVEGDTYGKVAQFLKRPRRN